jgi:DNA-binding GntR family transcriptional regulator
MSVECKQVSLANRVQSLILERTRNGKSFTTESELCEKFSVSRTSIRDILKELEVIGFIERKQRRGITVRNFNLKETIEIYDLREAVEGMAARLAAAHASPKDIAELKAIVEKHNQTTNSDDVNEKQDTDMNFHAKIIELSNNSMIIRMSRSLHMMEKAFKASETFTSRYPHCPLPATHEAIVEAFEAHDPDKAETLVKEHIRGAKQRLVEAFLQTDIN